MCWKEVWCMFKCHSKVCYIFFA